MRKFKHNKTGKEYELVQEHLLFKDKSLVEIEHDGYGSVTVVVDNELKWRNNDDLVLYKALYENPDGPYFVRHSEDFFKNFTEINTQNRIS